MKLESTPYRQQVHNDAVHKHVRVAGLLAILMLVGAVAFEVLLYVNLSPQSSEPSIVGPNGAPIGFAVVLAPEYVLTNADVLPGSQLVVGTERVALSLVRTEKLDGVFVSMLHLQTPYTKLIPGLRRVENGEAAIANSASGKWEGTLVDSGSSQSIEANPAITLGDIAALTAKSDGALLGISAPGAKGDIALGSRDLLAKFPELKK